MRADIAVKRITKDRMADLFHVHPQLMAAPGFGHEPKTGCAVCAGQYPPIGHGLPSVFVIDHLQRPVWPVDYQRQIYRAFALGKFARDDRNIRFPHPALFKL